MKLTANSFFSIDFKEVEWRKMKTIHKKIVIIIMAFLVVLGLTIIILNQLVPKAQPRWNVASEEVREANAGTELNYTAVGDSLTEGVGDVTNQGGFVHLLANNLEDYYGFKTVNDSNFGVAGERSDQINKRLTNDTDLQESLQAADFITVTVGGNDLLRVFQQNFFNNLSVDTFTEPMEEYQGRLEEMFDLIRQQNATAPIYVVGIYNPYYLTFSEITEIQTIFDNWNVSTEEIVEAEANAFFIPVNDLLYQGVNGNVGVGEDVSDEEMDSAATLDTAETTSSSTVESSTTESSTIDSSTRSTSNNALYDGDNFHPNNLGYQLIANAVRNELINTEALWMPEGGVPSETSQ